MRGYTWRQRPARHAGYDADWGGNPAEEYQAYLDLQRTKHQLTVALVSPESASRRRVDLCCVWLSVSAWFAGLLQGEGPSVVSGAGFRGVRGRVAWSGRCWGCAQAGEDFVEQVLSRW